MKKTLLIGLTAVALGSMTACSNILEEEGIVSPSAKTGTLTIGVEEDNSVSIVTKTDENTITNQEAGDDYKVKLYTNTNTYIEDEYEVVKDKSYSLPAANEAYTLESYNIDPTTISEFCMWDQPIYYRKKKKITIVGGTANSVDLTCTLKNSQITIDKSGLETDDATKVITVTSIKIKNGDQYFPVYGDGVQVNKKLGLNTLYVKDGIPAEIVLNVTRKDNINVNPVTTPLVKNGDKVSYTESAKNYKVSYSLSTEYGVATIKINVNNTITEVDLGNVVVNPYDSSN